MTDTTDIKALREKFGTLSEIGDFYYFAKDLLDQIEAERQRADKFERMLNTCYDQLNRAEKLVKTKDNDAQTAVYWAKIAAESLEELAALKAKLANPVVLGSSDVMSRNFAIKAIIEAGFTVKGE